MDKREEIIERMSKCAGELRDILIDVRAENAEGSQFDFASSARLANNTDSLRSVIYQIDKIVYQESDEK